MNRKWYFFEVIFISFLKSRENGVFFEEVGISQQQKGLLKIPLFYFPLYEVISFGSVIIGLALLNLPHIN